MRDEKYNPLVLALDDSHPAKRFLEAFLDCRADCVGRQHDFNGQVPIDQSWTSSTDGRVWTFSGFAYAFLSLDLLLDEFHQSAPSGNEANLNWPWNLPGVR